MIEKSFKVYIYRQLRNNFPNVHITRLGAEAVDGILRTIAERIVDRSLILTESDNKKTILASEIQTATKTILPEPLAEKCLAYSNTVLNKFNESEALRQKQKSEQKEQKKDDKNRTQTRESRCDLTFSVSATEKYVRRFGQIGYNVSSATPVVLASVLEALSKLILEVAQSEALQSKKITINVRHIFLSISKHPELNKFFSNMNIVFLESGVVPEDIKNKKHRRVKKTEEKETEVDSEKKKHRWRPGTKTVMQIRKLQKDGDMLIQHAPFNRIVKEVVSKFVGVDNNIRYTGEFLNCFQAYSENRLTNLMRTANKIVMHTNRETVYARDIDLAVDILNEGFTDTLHGEYESTVPEASLRQIAQRAGIKRYGDCCTASYLRYILRMLETYLHDMVACASHHKVQTLNSVILLEVMHMHGTFPAIISHKRKGVKRGDKDKTENNGEVELGATEVDENEPNAVPLSDIEEKSE